MFTLSMRAVERPWASAASIPARCLVIDPASFTNEGMRQRRAHFNHRSSRAMPAAPLRANTWRSCSFNR